MIMPTSDRKFDFHPTLIMHFYRPYNISSRRQNGIFIVTNQLIRKPEKYALFTGKKKTDIFSKTHKPALESTRTPIQMKPWALSL
jgi:hypothetical protein